MYTGVNSFNRFKPHFFGPGVPTMKNSRTVYGVSLILALAGASVAAWGADLTCTENTLSDNSNGYFRQFVLTQAPNGLYTASYAYEPCADLAQYGEKAAHWQSTDLNCQVTKDAKGISVLCGNLLTAKSDMLSNIVDIKIQNREFDSFEFWMSSCQ